MARLAIILTSIISLTVLVTVILIACSLSVLNYNEVGLNYSNWFKTMDNTTYTHGIHFIGLGHQFHKYLISLSTIDFSNDKNSTLPPIVCRTMDGLKVTVEVSLQYRVEKENIFKIYSNYGDSELPILYRTIIDVVNDVATMF